VLALAGNKNDLYEKEEVEESEGKKLAKEIGAIFQKTSAKESFGIEDLFIKIGLKFISPYNKDGNSTEKNEIKPDKKKIKLERIEGKQQRGCC